MISIPLNQPIVIGSQLWCDITEWSLDNNIRVRYNNRAVLFDDRHAEYAVIFRLKFGI